MGNVCMYVLSPTFIRGLDQSGMVANPARRQLNRKNDIFPVPVCGWEFGLARQVRPSRPASARPASARSGACTHRVSPAFHDGVNLFMPSTAIGSVPSLLSGHAITTYRWRCSLPRGRRRRASSPQGSSSIGNVKCMIRWLTLLAILNSRQLFDYPVVRLAQVLPSVLQHWWGSSLSIE